MKTEWWLGFSVLAGIAAVLWGNPPARADRGLSCPLPHPESAVAWSAPAGSLPPPIDRQVPAHLRVATFALG